MNARTAIAISLAALAIIAAGGYLLYQTRSTPPEASLPPAEPPAEETGAEEGQEEDQETDLAEAKGADPAQERGEAETPAETETPEEPGADPEPRDTAAAEEPEETPHPPDPEAKPAEEPKAEPEPSETAQAGEPTETPQAPAPDTQPAEEPEPEQRETARLEEPQAPPLPPATETAPEALDEEENAPQEPNTVKIGIMLAQDGPYGNIAPDMRKAALQAIGEANETGLFLDGARLEGAQIEAPCMDPGAALEAARELVHGQEVAGIVGPSCSAIVGEMVERIALPEETVMVSPSAQAARLAEIEDGGLFFRTASPESRQAEVMADILLEKGVKEVAITYTFNDYGLQLSQEFSSIYRERGGRVTVSAAHEEDPKAIEEHHRRMRKGLLARTLEGYREQAFGSGESQGTSGEGDPGDSAESAGDSGEENGRDYSFELAALAAAGGERLVLIGYSYGAAGKILRAAIDTGAFDTFHFSDSMLDAELQANFGLELTGSTGQRPEHTPARPAALPSMAESYNPETVFAGESYDAAALIMLAMQAAGSTDSRVYKGKIMEVANKPGIEIRPGEIGLALRTLRDGGDINYVGATEVELAERGEPAFRHIEFREGRERVMKHR